MTIYPIVTGPFREISYVIQETESPYAVIIDPGDDAEDIEMLINEHQLILKAVYLTHTHLDHINAVEYIQKAFDVPIYVHENEKFLFENSQMQGDLLHLKVNTLLHRIPEGMIHFFNLSNLDECHINTTKGRIIPCFGHTAGGVSYYFEDNPPRLFCGDTLFKGSVGRTDLWGGDWNTLMNSLINLLDSLPPETVIYPGHGETSTLGHERLTNPFLQEVL